MFALLVAAASFTAPSPAMQYDWFSPVYDFPKSRLKRNEPSITEAEITVNKYGYMESCTGHVFSGNPQMGPYVCERLKLRNVFNAARDPEGRRLYGVYRIFVILCNCDTQPKNYHHSDFEIAVPPSARDQLKDRTFEIQFAVDQEGRASACSLVREVGFGIYREKQNTDPALVAQACSELSSKMRTQPARDRKGAAVPSVQNAHVGALAR